MGLRVLITARVLLTIAAKRGNVLVAPWIVTTTTTAPSIRVIRPWGVLMAMVPMGGLALMGTLAHRTIPVTLEYAFRALKKTVHQVSVNKMVLVMR